MANCSFLSHVTTCLPISKINILYTSPLICITSGGRWYMTNCLSPCSFKGSGSRRRRRPWSDLYLYFTLTLSVCLLWKGQVVVLDVNIGDSLSPLFTLSLHLCLRVSLCLSVKSFLILHLFFGCSSFFPSFLSTPKCLHISSWK